MELYKSSLVRMNAKLQRNARLFGDELPFAVGTSAGRYVTHTGKGHWTDGFWPGLLLLGYSHTQNSPLLEAYERFEPFLEERVRNDPATNAAKGYLPLDHDVGFIFFLTSAYHGQLTGSQHSKEIALRAAESLSSRFHQQGRFIRAWDDWPSDSPEFRKEKKGKAIIDSLMNVPLLFWASGAADKREYRDMAIRHASRLAQFIVRSDGSTYHTYNFDPLTGQPVRGASVQGYADESCWSRGQAWAIYGFALCYRYTGLSEFCAAAKRCIDYWERFMLPNGDAPWDFGAPRREGLPIDTSAMAIAACGMLELASLTTDGAAYADQGRKLLDRLLTEHAVLTSPDAHAFLLHGCVGPAYKQGGPDEELRDCKYADQSLIYGDYFLYEAVLRLCCPHVLLPWHFGSKAL